MSKLKKMKTTMVHIGINIFWSDQKWTVRQSENICIRNARKLC